MAVAVVLHTGTDVLVCDQVTGCCQMRALYEVSSKYKQMLGFPGI